MKGWVELTATQWFCTQLITVTVFVGDTPKFLHLLWGFGKFSGSLGDPPIPHERKGCELRSPIPPKPCDFEQDYLENFVKGVIIIVGYSSKLKST